MCYFLMKGLTELPALPTYHVIKAKYTNTMAAYRLMVFEKL